MSDPNPTPGPAGPGGAGPPTTAAPNPRLRLTRREEGKVIAGVATGLGAYLGVDPVLIRVAFLLLAFFGGTGVGLYILAWVLIPPEDGSESAAETGLRRFSAAPTLAQVVIVVIAISMLASSFGAHGSGLGWGMLLIVAGYLLFRQDRRAATTSAPTQTPQPAPNTREDPAEDPAVTPADPHERDPLLAEAERLWDRPVEPVTPSSAPWAPAAPARAPSVLGRLTVAFGLIVAGVAAALDNAGVLDMTGERYLALALTVAGLGLLVGARFGRARGLIAVGLVLIPTLVLTSAVDVPLRGGVGQRVFQPQTLQEVRDQYRLAMGQLELDLSEVEFTSQPTVVEASVAMGQLDVTVPPDARVTVHTRTRVGDVEVFDVRRGGPMYPDDYTHPADGPEEGGQLVLRLEAGIGEVNVEREPF